MKETQTMDFATLSTGTVVVDLWYILHDATLHNLVSDLSARTVSLTFSMSHLQEMLEHTVDTKFLVRCEMIESVRVLTHRTLQPVFACPPKMSSQEYHRLAEENYVNGWWQSVDWANIERDFQDVGFSVLTTDAHVFEQEKGIVVRIAGELPNNEELEIVMVATSLTIMGESGTFYTLTNFVGLGEQFWERNRQRSERNQQSQPKSSEKRL